MWVNNGGGAEGFERKGTKGEGEGTAAAGRSTGALGTSGMSFPSAPLPSSAFSPYTTLRHGRPPAATSFDTLPSPAAGQTKGRGGREPRAADRGEGGLDNGQPKPKHCCWKKFRKARENKPFHSTGQGQKPIDPIQSSPVSIQSDCPLTTPFPFPHSLPSAQPICPAVERQTRWRRRLSPIKLMRRSSLLGGNSRTSSSSASPQRRTESPAEKRLIGMGVEMDKLDRDMLLLSMRRAGQGRQREEDGRGGANCLDCRPSSPPLPSTATTATTNGSTSKSASSQRPLAMPTSVNQQNGSASASTALQPSHTSAERVSSPNMKNNRPQQQTERPAAGAQHYESATTSMSASMLASAAWYRDREGRTGYRPEEFPPGTRMQRSPIKVVQPMARSSSKESQIPVASAKVQQPSGSVVRHSCTLPAATHHHCPRPIAGNGLPPLPPAQGGPFHLRRTAKLTELPAGREPPPAANGTMGYWTLADGGRGGNNRMGAGARAHQAENGGGEESPTSRAQQKFVKFAETVQVAEIAARDSPDREGSICSCSASSSASSSSCSSSSSSSASCPHPAAAANAFSSERENKRNGDNNSRLRRPLQIGEHRRTGAAITNGDIPQAKQRAATGAGGGGGGGQPPPLAVVRPSLASTSANSSPVRAQGTWPKRGRVEKEHRLKEESGRAEFTTIGGNKPRADPEELEQVIEQFFRHCQSLAALNNSGEGGQGHERREQFPSPVQQRSVYDNLAGEETVGQQPARSTDCWLYTKAKVLAQAGGPSSVGRRRETQLEMLVLGEGGDSRRTAATTTNGGGRRAAVNGGGGSSGNWTTANNDGLSGTAARKAVSADPVSRLPLPRNALLHRTPPSPSARGQGMPPMASFGPQSDSSSSTTSSASFMAARGGQRPFATVRSRSRC